MSDKLSLTNQKYNYELYTTGDLIDCLPENRPLYKDGGLWQIRSDDMLYVYMAQGTNESFRDFIIRYIESLEGKSVFLEAKETSEIDCINVDKTLIENAINPEEVAQRGREIARRFLTEHDSISVQKKKLKY